MRTADPDPIAASLLVLMIADDAGGRRELTELLRESRFVVAVPSVQNDVVLSRQTRKLVVLAPSEQGAARLERIATTAAAHPDVPMVAVMPGDAGSRVLRRALRSGADGIVLEGREHATLIPTVHAVAAGQLAVPDSMRRQVAPRPLSFREKEILELVVRGYTNRQIADKLFVAESTVKTHLSSAFSKLGTRSRAEASALILDPDEGDGLGILSISSAAGRAA